MTDTMTTQIVLASRPEGPAADVARSFEDSVLPVVQAGQARLIGDGHRIDFEGCRARIVTPPSSPDQGDAEIEFADGSATSGHFHRLSETELQLWMQPYITSQGNSVSAHSWRLEPTSAADVWKVSRKGA